MEYEKKSMLLRLIQVLGFLLFVITIGSYLLYALPSLGTEGYDRAIYPYLLLFGMTFTVIVISFLIYYGLFTGEERRRFTLERSGGKKGEPPSFVMMPDEAVVMAPVQCFYRISNAFGYRENTGWATVTGKRIDIKRPAREMNFWRKEVKEIPKRGFTLIGTYIDDYTIQSVSYEEETEGGKTTGYLKLGLGEVSVMVEVKLYHPRAKEIADMFSK